MCHDAEEALHHCLHRNRLLWVTARRSLALLRHISHRQEARQHSREVAQANVCHDFQLLFDAKTSMRATEPWHAARALRSSPYEHVPLVHSVVERKCT